MTEAPRPAAFNTGQVMFGWLAALEELRDERFAEACGRAGRYLVQTLSPDGWWPASESPYARGSSTRYNARTAWALAEAGQRLGEPAFVDAAARHLAVVRSADLPNGWLPDCCLGDPHRPLLHTLAYAVRGLLEGGRVLGDDRLTAAAIRTSDALAGLVREDGWMSGRFLSDWRPAVRWSCLTGQAQCANNWMRLAVITGDRRWLEPARAVVGFLRRTHDVTSSDPGLRGGVRGSWPVHGDYGRFEVLNWATKFWCDALMRWEDVEAGGAGAPCGVHILA